MAVFSAAAARKAGRKQRKAQAKLDNLLANRQQIINPYSNVSDLSDMISNPFANLQVATQAAEMQADEADISLANTLDTLRATGAGSAGATALAQAALRSKQGISATIEQQEAQNARLRAQGEQQAMTMRLAQAQRVQDADVMGRTFMFQARESREIANISREAGMVQQYGQQEADARGAMGSNFATALGGIAQGVGSALSDRRLKQDIEFVRLSPSGLKIYSFKYKNAEGVYEGVMSDEIPADAVIKNFIGIYDGVDYSKIDVEFKRIK
tara:strand:+ start:256 stop:1065 length:810 start_codon:yes stop_codon:yes gene_type:complete